MEMDRIQNETEEKMKQWMQYIKDRQECNSQMGKCDVKGPQMEVSNSNRNKNENSARTTKETTTDQQRNKMNAVNTENKNKHKNINKVKNIYTNDVKIDYTNDELKIGPETTEVVPTNMYQKNYKRTRGKKKISTHLGS